MLDSNSGGRRHTGDGEIFRQECRTIEGESIILVVLLSMRCIRACLPLSSVLMSLTLSKSMVFDSSEVISINRKHQNG